MLGVYLKAYGWLYSSNMCISNFAYNQGLFMNVS